jgi:hypothetical protein
MIIGKATKESETGGGLPDPQLLEDMNKFNDELIKADIVLAYEGLQPSSKGARVHFSGKDRTVTDGPFAETKELIAGFSMWKVKSLQEAIAWVKRSPTCSKDEYEVEIRQVFEPEEFAPIATEGQLEEELKIREQFAKNSLHKGKKRFMVIVKASKESETGKLPDPELFAEMDKFNDEIIKAGIVLTYDGLHSSSKGARVRFSGKDRTVIDGPFTESKELVAGFWIWQVKSLEEAIEWVKRCPNPDGGESDIEIRQVFEPEDFAPIATEEQIQQEHEIREQLAKK